MARNDRMTYIKGQDYSEGYYNGYSTAWDEADKEITKLNAKIEELNN